MVQTCKNVRPEAENFCYLRRGFKNNRRIFILPKASNCNTTIISKHRGGFPQGHKICRLRLYMLVFTAGQFLLQMDDKQSNNPGCRGQHAAMGRILCTRTKQCTVE